jgi:alcohol dehydrogenase class IV
MQAVMRFNRSEIEDRFVAAARYFGIKGGFDGFYDFVGGLVTHLNIPKNLTDLGLRDLGDAELDRIVAAALTDPSAGGNPRELTAKNTRALLEACF